MNKKEAIGFDDLLGVCEHRSNSGAIDATNGTPAMMRYFAGEMVRPR